MINKRNKPGDGTIGKTRIRKALETEIKEWDDQLLIKCMLFLLVLIAFGWVINLYQGKHLKRQINLIGYLNLESGWIDWL